MMCVPIVIHIYVCVCTHTYTYYILFTHSSVDVHEVFSFILAIVNYASVNIDIKYLF
jgi:hypothetical protein